MCPDFCGGVVRHYVVQRGHGGLHAIDLGIRIRIVGIRSAQPGVKVVVTHRDYQHSVALLDPPGQGVVDQLPIIRSGAGLHDGQQIFEGLFFVPGTCGLAEHAIVVSLFVEMANTATVQVHPQGRLVSCAAIGRIQDHERIITGYPALVGGIAVEIDVQTQTGLGYRPFTSKCDAAGSSADPELGLQIRCDRIIDQYAVFA